MRLPGRRDLATALASMLALAGGACSPPAPSSSPSSSPAVAAASSAQRLRMEPAGPGPADVVVKTTLTRSRAEGRRTLVIVGAPWCEPCVRLHEAAARGELDAALGTVDLIEFNLDVDRERLEAAGYASRMIPLLVVPDDDGRGTDRRMAGSIKGEGAVAEMLPRIQQLLR